MRLLANVRTRLFIVCWVIYSAFFATNIVREHYPAFTLIDHFNLQCDEYLGWHADIFQHSDGHSYINSSVASSVLAALPLLIFDPVLDQLEAYSKRKLAAAGGTVDTSYDTKYPNRQAMFKKVKLAGKDLRLGASAAVTSAFLMAPLSALCVVLMFDFLRRRRVPRDRAIWLSLLFAFGTPLFFRTAHLNHNMLMMSSVFGAFLLLFDGREEYAISAGRRFWAGILCGITFAIDYSGAIPAALLYLYFVVARSGSAGPGASFRESLAVIGGGLPGLFLVLGSQYSQFGDPFTPAQFVMATTSYSGEGLGGIGWPSFEIFIKGLISPSWGMYTYGPLLLIGLWPTRGRANDELILPRRERRMASILIVSFLIFCAMNRFSLMQFNTGFRYLVPLVPLIFLQASDQLVRWNRRALAVVTLLAVLHTTVLSMTREVNDTENDLRMAAVAEGISQLQVPGYFGVMLSETPIPVAYYRVFVSEGVQLPWLKVLGQTSGSALLTGAWLPVVLILMVLLFCCGLWWLGERAERQRSDELHHRHPGTTRD